MNNRLFVLLLFALFMAISCEKEQSPVVENIGTPLIVKEIFSDDLYNEFTYNEQNLLKERKSRWFYTRYNYNSYNRITSTDMYEDPGIYSSNWETANAAMNRTEWVSPENTEKTARGMYHYQNSKIITVTVTQLVSNTSWFSYYQYDDSHRVETQFFYVNNAGTGFIHYLYDEIGNVIQEDHYNFISGTSVLESTKSFEFDDRHNPFKVFKQLLTPGIYTNENNIIRETLTLMKENQVVDSVQVTESVYQYNDQDYPVTKDGFIRYEYK